MRPLSQNVLTVLALVVLSAGAAQPTAAQGKSHGKGGATASPGHAKKQVATPARAVSVTRDVLVAQGYEVVRVESVNDTQVIYYRRGNMGRGKGKGPIVKMIVRPTPDRIVFVSAPSKALVEINLRLGQ